jgi:hypothetical protein
MLLVLDADLTGLVKVRFFEHCSLLFSCSSFATGDIGASPMQLPCLMPNSSF